MDSITFSHMWAEQTHRILGARAVAERIAAEEAAALAQVVAIVAGEEVTRGQLREVFDLVADPANWKNPIDRVVPWAACNSVGTLREAVVFFTGSVPTIEHDEVGGLGLRVRAAGYYAAVGA